MSAAVLEVFDYSVEGRASRARGNRDGVHVKFDCDDTALVASAHLVGNVEDEGGVHAVVELHGNV